MEDANNKSPQIVNPQTTTTSENYFNPFNCTGPLNWVVKIAFILLALAIFQIPLYMVKSLTKERQKKLVQVQSEIIRDWGNKQAISLHSQAQNSNINAEIISEVRYRGIYQAVVYTANIAINSKLNNQSLEKEVITIADPSGIVDIAVKVNGNETPFTVEGAKLAFAIPKGLVNYDINIKLRGSSTLVFESKADSNTVTIAGTWDSPSFIGNTLPSNRTISDEKFTSEWNFKNFKKEKCEFGVELCLPAGTYQQVERCFSYATFFLIVFFFTLLVAEAVTKVNIHILQYLIAAGAPILFYLMALAFGEKLGFTVGYIISAAIIVLMVTMYSRMFLGKTRHALIMGAIFAASYFMNYIILQMEDLALLSGTIVLAIILGVLMIFTGKINRK